MSKWYHITTEEETLSIEFIEDWTKHPKLGFLYGPFKTFTKAKIDAQLTWKKRIADAEEQIIKVGKLIRQETNNPQPKGR